MASIATITSLILAYRYLIIVPLALIWQPLVGMLCGVLARLGYFDPFIVYGVLVVTAVLGDALWYWIGYRWGVSFAARFGRFFSITPKHIAGVRRIFSRYHTSILLISKLTNGMGFALVTLFTAGMSRVPFWKFVGLNIVGESIWSAMIVSIGYFLGDVYVSVNNVLGKVFITVAVVVLLVVAFGAANYIRKRIMAEAGEEEQA
ncbi:MAG TPA: DedA family protein [Candidatus Paceibacterota bacterium]|nr:DedA family protein [Candidatus Paceibacterota bacterium]